MISIRKSASIGINSAALDEFFDEDDEGIVFYFDEDTGRVGLKAVQDKEEHDNAYTLSRSNGTGSVAPGSFLKKHDLVPERTMQYSPREIKVNQNLKLIGFDTGEHSDDFLGYYGNADDE